MFVRRAHHLRFALAPLLTSLCLLALSALPAFAASPSAPIPEAELLHAPKPQRLAALHASAQRDGWAAQVGPLREAALAAYRRDKTLAAQGWFQAYSWAALFAKPETEFLLQWIAAVNEAKVGHANMSRQFNPPAEPLGRLVAPELQSWLVSNAAFSEEFFGLLTPVDYLPAVFRTLDQLFRADPAKFRTYASLALALAVVYDLPPPPIWPHGQVTEKVLPRRFPDAAEAFAWWTKQDQLGRTYHKLARLGADELKFVIDAAAPFRELEWAQEAADLPLAHLDRAYGMIRYRNDRVANNRPIWPGEKYTLPQILGAGGICSDQAYFATQVGKARGVPTLLFYGAGNDGRHAWFGFLDAQRKWHLDAGRYAEQRFVTGFARDPQTWREFSDHQLKFLGERFRELPSYKQAQVHALFASELLRLGETNAATAAARKSVNFERRYQPGWELLLAIARHEKREARTLEGLLREAAAAFQRYPDLELHYVNQLANSLRSRGQASEADAELRRVAVKNQGERGDIAVQQARDALVRAIATQPLAQQVAAYNRMVDTYGRSGGIAFFDDIVVGFTEHLLKTGKKAEATQALERARRTLQIEPNSQLAREFAELAERVRAAK